MKKVALRNCMIICTLALIFGFLVIHDPSLLNKAKAQIFSNDLSTVEYNWYFNPREDGKQPEPIKEANFFKKYNTYYVGNPNEKVIYLTFDSGYENGYTNMMLDVLKKHKAPANFFVVKSYIENNPDIIKRMEKEGHLVCNHSKSHVSMASIHDIDKFKDEILSVSNAYKEVTGKEMPKYFRPPMGKFSEESLKYTSDMGYSSIFWSFAYVDWYNNQQPTHEFAKNKIYSRTHPGAIVLLHSNSKTNCEILDEVITHWEEEGYTLKSLEHLTQNKK
ncbi:delta-lactam-biosynthetic de-N-acetylase [Terrisporobacter sp.]|uniref:delta-lactam-biosynthetic de-N-acetylase n=1 Tax=Terrisporobacter sp. TaxID=1965305 RepID=UPI002619108F|nr:delta-lactam-biosynthetic de-N-acetylase [Terrisporobacter sp.]